MVSKLIQMLMREKNKYKNVIARTNIYIYTVYYFYINRYMNNNFFFFYNNRSYRLYYSRNKGVHYIYRQSSKRFTKSHHKNDITHYIRWSTVHIIMIHIAVARSHT